MVGGPIGYIGPSQADFRPLLERLKMQMANQQFGAELNERRAGRVSREELERSSLAQAGQQFAQRHSLDQAQLAQAGQQFAERQNLDREELGQRKEIATANETLARDQMAADEAARSAETERRAAAEGERAAMKTAKEAEETEDLERKGKIAGLVREYVSKYNLDPNDVRALLLGQTPSDPKDAAKWSEAVGKAMDDVYRAESQALDSDYKRAQTERALRPAAEKAEPSLTPGQRVTYWAGRAKELNKAKQKIAKAAVDPEYAQFLGMDPADVEAQLAELDAALADAQAEIDKAMGAE